MFTVVRREVVKETERWMREEVCDVLREEGVVLARRHD
jgi:hypothetical protein